MFLLPTTYYLLPTGIPGFRISENPKFCISVFPCFRESGIPRFRVSGIPDFRDSGIPRFRDSEVPRFRDSGIPGLHRFREFGIPGSRDSEIPRSRDPEIPRFRDSGVPGFWGSGIGILRFRSPNIVSSLLYRGVVLVHPPLPPLRPGIVIMFFFNNCYSSSDTGSQIPAQAAGKDSSASGCLVLIMAIVTSLSEPQLRRIF